jgi:hypothetical protein
MNSEQILYKIKKYRKLLQNNLVGGNANIINYKLNKYNEMLGGELTQSDIDKVSSDIKDFIVKETQNITDFEVKIKEIIQNHSKLEQEIKKLIVEFTKEVEKSSKLDQRIDTLGVDLAKQIQENIQLKKSYDEELKSHNDVKAQNIDLQVQLNQQKREKADIDKKIDAIILHARELETYINTYRIQINADLKQKLNYIATNQFDKLFYETKPLIVTAVPQPFGAPSKLLVVKEAEQSDIVSEEIRERLNELDPQDRPRVKQVYYIANNYLNKDKSRDDMLTEIKEYGTINNYFTLIVNKLSELISFLKTPATENQEYNSLIKNIIFRIIYVYYKVTTIPNKNNEELKVFRQQPENKLDIRPLYNLLNDNQKNKIKKELKYYTDIIYNKDIFNSYMTRTLTQGLPQELLLLGGQDKLNVNVIKMLNYKNNL